MDIIIYIAQQKFRTLMSRPAKHDRRCSKGRSLYLLNYLEPDFFEFKSTLFPPIHVILIHFLHKLWTNSGIEYFTNTECFISQCRLNIIHIEKYYRKVASSNMSCLEAHAGFFRLLMKGIYGPYALWPFDKKLIS